MEGLPESVRTEACRTIDLSRWANVDALRAPFGVSQPERSRYTFTGVPVGEQTRDGIPFLVPERLSVLHGKSASGSFPLEVRILLKTRGGGLFILGNVGGWTGSDSGVGERGAVAENRIRYAEGKEQVVPLMPGMILDDWVAPPMAIEVFPFAQRRSRWHLNLLTIKLRPAPVEALMFRDLGAPTAPLLGAITIEQ